MAAMRRPWIMLRWLLRSRLSTHRNDFPDPESGYPTLRQRNGERMGHGAFLAMRTRSFPPGAKALVRYAGVIGGLKPPPLSVPLTKSFFGERVLCRVGFSAAIICRRLCVRRGRRSQGCRCLDSRER